MSEFYQNNANNSIQLKLVALPGDTMLMTKITRPYDARASLQSKIYNTATRFKRLEQKLLAFHEIISRAERTGESLPGKNKMVSELRRLNTTSGRKQKEFERASKTDPTLHLPLEVYNQVVFCLVNSGFLLYQIEKLEERAEEMPGAADQGPEQIDHDVVAGETEEYALYVDEVLSELGDPKYLKK